MEPIDARNTGVARREETFPVVAGELALCFLDPHSAVEAVGLAVMVRGSGPITKNVGEGEVEVRFPLPRRFGESGPMRLV